MPIGLCNGENYYRSAGIKWKLFPGRNSGSDVELKGADGSFLA